MDGCCGLTEGVGIMDIMGYLESRGFCPSCKLTIKYAQPGQPMAICRRCRRLVPSFRPTLFERIARAFRSIRRWFFPFWGYDSGVRRMPLDKAVKEQR